MSRIIIDSRSGALDLAETFLKALGLLHDAEINPRPGTRLISRYAVIVVDDAATDRAVAQLCGASVSATKEAA